MPTLIEEIQRDCIDSTASVSFLLRKVKLAAGKLGVAKVEEWGGPRAEWLYLYRQGA